MAGFVLLGVVWAFAVPTRNAIEIAIGSAPFYLIFGALWGVVVGLLVATARLASRRTAA